MKLPKIRLRLTKSKSKTKHTLEQMQVCYDAISYQSGVEIWSVEKDCKSIKGEDGLYIIQVSGYCWDSWVAGDYKKANEVWYNSGDLPFTNHCFDLRSAILDEFISVFSAVKNFNFTLEKDDPDYMLLREEYDYAKHVLAIPREKRNNFYTWKYDAANVLNN